MADLGGATEDDGPGAGGVSLDTSRTTFPVQGKRDGDQGKRNESRRLRFRRRRLAQSLSRMPRLCACGRSIVDTSGVVQLRVTDGRAGFGGLATCGSVWVCAVCSAKVAARRALEIGSVVALARAEGFSVGFLTLTMRHHRGQRLSQLWDALSAAWNAVTGGNGWLADKRRVGVVGFVRVVEVTFGSNGWHVHVHALVVSEKMNSEQLDRLGISMFGRWERSLVRAGLDAPLPQGSDWQLVVDGDLSGTKLGEYLSKGLHSAVGIGLELTSNQGKVARARHSTRQVWEMLDEFGQTGDMDWRTLWGEWEAGSKGRRQIAWSKGLRQRFQIGDERTDEEIAADELGTREDTLCVITASGWGQLLRQSDLIPSVLELAEEGGWDSVSRFLTAYEIEHRKV